MVLESVTCFRIEGRKVSAYYLGLTILDCFLIKHNKNPDNDDVFDSDVCSKVSIAARKQNKPGSRDSHLDRWIYQQQTREGRSRDLHRRINKSNRRETKLCGWRDLFFFRGRRGSNAKGTIMDGVTSGRNNCHLY